MERDNLVGEAHKEKRDEAKCPRDKYVHQMQPGGGVEEMLGQGIPFFAVGKTGFSRSEERLSAEAIVPAFP